MIKSVTYLSRREAERTIGMRHMGIISICDTESAGAKLKGRWGGVLRIHFDDVEREWQGYIPMGREDAEKILAWLWANVAGFKKLFVHCEAGISRSFAVAEFVGEKYGIPVDGPNKARPNSVVGQWLRQVDRGD